MSIEQTPYQKAQLILFHYANIFAQVSMYNWSDEFSKKEILRVVTMAKEHVGRIDFTSFTKEELYSLGAGNWDEHLVLLPGWMYHHLAYDQKLCCIGSRDVVVKEGYEVSGSDDYIDNDVRFGCLAYGVRFGDPA